MTQRMFYIIAVSRTVGHMDILAMTHGANLREVTNLLSSGQESRDGPGICAGAFQLKLEEFLHMVNNKDLFRNSLT